MPWQQFKAGRCATKSRQRWMPASRKNAGSLPLLTASAPAAFLSQERAGEIFRSPVPTDPRARLSPAGTSTPSALPGRSELCPAAAHTKACVWPKAAVPHGRAARREDMGRKNLQSKFLFLPGMKAAPAEGQHRAAFLYFSAPLQEAQRRGFQAAVLVAVCSQGQERSFGHKPSLKKKKK